MRLVRSNPPQISHNLRPLPWPVVGSAKSPSNVPTALVLRTPVRPREAPPSVSSRHSCVRSRFTARNPDVGRSVSRRSVRRRFPCALVSYRPVRRDSDGRGPAFGAGGWLGDARRASRLTGALRRSQDRTPSDLTTEHSVHEIRKVLARVAAVRHEDVAVHLVPPHSKGQA